MSLSRPDLLLPELIIALKGHIRLIQMVDANIKKDQTEVDKLTKLVADIDVVANDVSDDDTKKARIKALLTAALVDAYVHEERETSLTNLFMKGRMNVLGPNVKAYEDIIVTPLKGHNFLLPADYYDKKHDTNEFVEIYLETISNDPQIIQTLFHLDLKYFVSAVIKAKGFNDETYKEDRDLMVSIEKVLARMSASQVKLWNDLVQERLAKNKAAQSVFLVATGPDGKADKTAKEKDTSNRLKDQIKDAGNNKNELVMMAIQEVLQQFETSLGSNEVIAESKVEAATTPSSATTERTDESFVPKLLSVTTMESPRSEKQEAIVTSPVSTSSTSAARIALLNSIAMTTPRTLKSVTPTATSINASVLTDTPPPLLSTVASSPRSSQTVVVSPKNTSGNVPLASSLDVVPPTAPTLDAVPPPPPPPLTVASATSPKAPIDHLVAIRSGAKLKKIEDTKAQTTESKTTVSTATSPPAPTLDTVPPPPPLTIAPATSPTAPVSHLAAIQKGFTLKATSPKPVDHLAAIRGGAKLRKIEDTKAQTTESNGSKATSPKVMLTPIQENGSTSIPAPPAPTFTAATAPLSLDSNTAVTPPGLTVVTKKLTLQEQIAETRRKKAEAAAAEAAKKPVGKSQPSSPQPADSGPVSPASVSSGATTATTSPSSSSSGSTAVSGMFGDQKFKDLMAKRKRMADAAASKDNTPSSNGPARTTTFGTM